MTHHRKQIVALAASVLLALAACTRSPEKASAPTVEALTADEGLLTGTLRNVAQALRNKTGRSAGDSRDGGSFADILALSIEPRVSGQV